MKSNESISYAEIPSKVCSGVSIDDGNKKLVEEITGWMIKRLGYKIKDSGLVCRQLVTSLLLSSNLTSHPLCEF